jgi:exodeoxyribonuclease VII large subunit
LRERHPERVLARWRERLGALQLRLEHAMAVRRERSQKQLARASNRLEVLSPLAILGRGYSITLDETGRAIRRASEVSPGSQLRVRLHQGALQVTVDAAREDE